MRNPPLAGSHPALKFLAALNQDLISALRGADLRLLQLSATWGVRRMRFERAVRVSHAGKLPAFFKHTNALVEEALRYGIGNLASASAEMRSTGDP